MKVRPVAGQHFIIPCQPCTFFRQGVLCFLVGLVKDLDNGKICLRVPEEFKSFIFLDQVIDLRVQRIIAFAKTSFLEFVGIAQLHLNSGDYTQGPQIQTCDLPCIGVANSS